MFKNELYKILVKQKFVFIIPVLLALKILSLSLETPFINANIENCHDAFVSYISGVSGKLTLKTQKKLDSDYSNMLEGRKSYTALRNGYENGTVSEEEYRAAVVDIEDSLNEAEVVELAHEEYLYALKSPKDRYIMYTNGWEAFLAHERLDIVLVLAVLVCAAVLFGQDYESGAYQLVNTSALGKSRLFIVRQGVLVIAVLGMCVLFFASEYIFFFLKYGLPQPSAPLQSLISFRESPYHLSILGAISLIWIFRFLGCLLLSECTVFCISIFRKIWLSILICAAYVGIPYALWNTTKAHPYYFQPLGLLLGNGYLKGKSDFVGEGIMLVSGPFEGVAPAHFILMLAISICAGGVLCVLSLHLQAQGSLRHMWKGYAAALLCCGVLAGAGVIGLCACLKEQAQEYNSVYSSGMGFGDEDYIYAMDGKEGLLAMDHDGRDAFSLVRDVASKSQGDIIACYIDEDFIYYVQRNLDYGEVSYWRISKEDFHETCVYKEQRGWRNQQKTGRYLGLLYSVNFENVEYEAYDREEITAFWADGDFLFVQDKNGINLIDLKKRSSEQILKCQAAAGCVAYEKGVVYYADLQNRVYAYDMADGRTTELEISHCYRLYLCGGILFYTTFDHKVGYYDGSAHLLDNLTISDTSHITSDGERAYFCSSGYEPVAVSLKDFSSTSLKCEKPAYDIRAYEYSPYVRIYMEGENAGEFIWKTCLPD